MEIGGPEVVLDGAAAATAPASPRFAHAGDLRYARGGNWIRQGLPGLVGALLEALEHAVLHQWRAGSLVPPACCVQPQYEVEGRRARTVQTSLGPVHFTWHRLRCRRGHARWIPLRAWLGLAPGQRHSRELERQAREAAQAQS